MTELDIIKEYFGKDWKYVESYYIPRDLLHDIRFIIRNGEKILQVEKLVKIKYNKPIWKNQDFTKDDQMYIWLDVPTIAE